MFLLKLVVVVLWVGGLGVEGGPPKRPNTHTHGSTEGHTISKNLHTISVDLLCRYLITHT